MSRKSRISFEIKIKYVQDYFAGKVSISDVCKELNIARWTFQWWITKYNLNGAEGLRQTSQNTKYPKEVKNFAVEDYLLGRGSLLDICKSTIFLQIQYFVGGLKCIIIVINNVKLLMLRRINL